MAGLRPYADVLLCCFFFPLLW
uniref:Uncharacterized protein n=1 Tax=Anguilla anguilla TaxID=7936 RepID=A0A0E9PIY0_ANGAN